MIKIYVLIIKKTNINDFLNYIIATKYTKESSNKSSKLVYNSLNKIIDFNDILIEAKETEENIIKDIINVSKEEQKPQNQEKPIIYIYSSHDTEEYQEPTSKIHSITPNVKVASYILKDHLNDLGIKSTVEKRKISDYLKKHNLNYYGSYDASRYYIQTSMKENDYKIIIDLHRDSIKRNLSVYENNNKKYAKILFVLTKKHKNYKENEKFVKKLNEKINENYKGLSRGIMNREDAIFNQDLSPHAILLEVGGVDNTLEEINNTLYVIAKVLHDYINNGELNG